MMRRRIDDDNSYGDDDGELERDKAVFLKWNECIVRASLSAVTIHKFNSAVRTWSRAVVGESSNSDPGFINNVNHTTNAMLQSIYWAHQPTIVWCTVPFYKIKV